MKIRRTWANTLILSLGAILVGVLLLVASGEVTGARKVLFQHVGSFVIASVAMALIFEFWQLRSLLNDLYEQAGITEKIQRAGISSVSVLFQDGVDWDRLFRESRRLGIVFAYGSTWRNTHQHRLREFLRAADAELDVVLPDPQNDIIMAEMALRFGEIPPDELRGRIQDATRFFIELDHQFAGTVRVFYVNRSLTHSFYRFDTKAVLASYRMRPGRGPVVTVVVDNGGELYEWIKDEWYGIVRDGIDDGTTERAYPRAAPAGDE